MALFDFLKRKKQIDKAKEKKISFANFPSYKSSDGQRATEEQSKKPAEKEVKTLVAKETKATRVKKDVKGFSYEVLKEPHVSEKSTNLSQENKYVFKIYNNTNNPEIKKAVEGIYGVDVLNVNIIKIPKKKRRIGRTEGFRKGYRKAVVTIKEGQKIEIF